MTDNTLHPIFGLSLLDSDGPPNSRQHMADLLTLLRAIHQLSLTLAIPFETFGLKLKNE